MVDGDLSGGRYLFGHNSCDGCTVEEIKLLNNRQAQHWMAIAETTTGRKVGYDGVSEWAVRSRTRRPRRRLGATPATSDPFRRPHLRRRAASAASELYPGKVIGFNLYTIDNDATEFRRNGAA